MLFIYISALIGFLIIFAYCAYIVYKDKQLPNSISQSIFSLNEENKWLFSAIMIIVGIMIIPQIIEVASDNLKFLSFLTVVGLLGVGSDPLTKNEKHIIHYTFAAIMGVSCQLLILFMNPLLLMTWIPYIIYTLYMDDGSKNMFVGEICMMIGTAFLCLM